ncbi:MAG: aminotransferase class I/II-fold pyridoxal phosphate-dependent enzyme [Bacteroidales bacterium]|nr:aminotransferase class I/II-fold pyridoxal phosphate-dependent enzyme [Bacteroidales bacterium]
MIIDPADRLHTVKEYYFSKKLKEIARMRADGKPVLNLGIGSPDRPPSEEVIQTLQREAEKDHAHGYKGYVGLPELRNAFSEWYKRYYNVILDPDKEILPLIGSKEGILYISMAFLNPGDGVLIPDPGYPTYQAVSQLMQADILTYDLDEQNNWAPDFEKLEQRDLSNVKLMWVNYPNMPTGATASADLFAKLVEFGRKHHILICNDNPYSFILNENPRSILEADGAKEVAIELNSLSKSHNMAGWRVGMLGGKDEYIQTVQKVNSNVHSGMFYAVQQAAVTALQLPDEWYRELNSMYQKRRTIVREIFDLLNCNYSKDATGLFVWAKIPDEAEDAETLSEEILHQANVFITPGFIFGENGKRYLRISLCSNENDLQEAKSRIHQTIN